VRTQRALEEELEAAWAGASGEEVWIAGRRVQCVEASVRTRRSWEEGLEAAWAGASGEEVWIAGRRVQCVEASVRTRRSCEEGGRGVWRVRRILFDCGGGMDACGGGAPQSAHQGLLAWPVAAPARAAVVLKAHQDRTAAARKRRVQVKAVYGAAAEGGRRVRHEYDVSVRTRRDVCVGSRPFGGSTRQVLGPWAEASGWKRVRKARREADGFGTCSRGVLGFT
jgi:hypothetical protein